MSYQMALKLKKQHADLTKDRRGLERKRENRRLELVFYEKDPRQYAMQIAQITEEILRLGNEIDKVQAQLDKIEKEAVALPW